MTGSSGSSRLSILRRFPLAVTAVFALAAIAVAIIVWEFAIEEFVVSGLEREPGQSAIVDFFEPMLLLVGVAFSAAMLFAGYQIGRRGIAERALIATRERLESIDTSPDWIWETDPRGFIVYVSPKIRDVLGYEPEEVIGRRSLELMPPEDAERVRSMLGEVMRDHRPFSVFEVTNLHKDGRRVLLESSGAPIYMDGRFRGYRGINRDITERKAMEKALRESEERYRAIFCTSPDLIALNRMSDGLFIDVNDGFLNQTGFTRDEVVGRTSAELGIWVDHAEYERLAVDLRDQGLVANRTAHFRGKDGAEFIGLLSAGIITLNGIEHLLSVGRDISALHDTQQALRESEERMRSLLEAVSIGVGVEDLDGNPIAVNVGLAAMLGYSTEELKGMSFRDFTHPDYIEEDNRSLRELASGVRRTYQMEQRFLRKDGKIVWGRLTRALVVDAKGRPAYCLGMVEDITERKRAEEALRESRDNFVKIFRASPVAMGISRMESGVVVDVNRAWQVFSGYSWSDTVGRSGEEIGYWPDLARRKAFFDLARRENSVRNFEAVLVARDGSHKEVVIAAEATDIGGKPHILWAIEDVSERKRNQDFLYHAQKMEAIGQLTGGVAHDFNNILAVILTNAECLKEEMDPADDRRDLVEAICTATDRAADLTGRLLAFSRRKSLNPQSVDLKRVVEDIVVMLRRTLSANIEIRLRGSERSPSVDLDRGQLENALLNLAINARDAMANQGVLTVAVDEVDVPARHGGVAAIPAGRYAKISVIDDGCGMPPEVAERIFEPFFTTKPQGEGTGLGLSMVYGFVRQSGGFIDVASAIGKGTTFDLLFPVARKSVKADAERPSPAAGRNGGDDAVGTDLRVLLAEDDGAVRLATRRMLESIGARVSDAADGEQAIEMLSSMDGCDILVTDVVMPGKLSGADLADAVRRCVPGIKVLFISGYARGRLDDTKINVPATRFLQKPFRHADLVEAIRDLVARDG